MYKRQNIVIAVSEGIKSSDGQYICEGGTSSKGTDSFGHVSLGGTALTLSALIGRELGIKSRGIVLSTLQRCASHWVSRRDMTEAYTVGADEMCIRDRSSPPVTEQTLSKASLFINVTTAS